MSDKPKLRGKPFEKGDPRAGRPFGAPNKVTQEVRELCGNLLEDEEYRASFKLRMITGTLAPPLEQMVWYYRHGKPKETVEISGANGGPLSILALTTAERQAYLETLLKKEATPEDDWGDDTAALAPVPSDDSDAES